MMGWFLAPLFFIAVTEFWLLRAAYKDLGEMSQENAALKMSNRKLNEMLRISARPATSLADSIDRMRNEGL